MTLHFRASAPNSHTPTRLFVWTYILWLIPYMKGVLGLLAGLVPEGLLTHSGPRIEPGYLPYRVSKAS
jgi:hypothetical protein